MKKIVRENRNESTKDKIYEKHLLKKEVQKTKEIFEEEFQQEKNEVEGTLILKNMNKTIIVPFTEENTDFNKDGIDLYEELKERGYPELSNENFFKKYLHDIFEFGHISFEIANDSENNRKPNLWRRIQDQLDLDTPVEESLDTCIDGVIVDITDFYEAQNYFKEKGYSLNKGIAYEKNDDTCDIKLYLRCIKKQESYEKMKFCAQTHFGSYFHISLFQKAYLIWNLTEFIMQNEYYEIEETLLKKEFFKFYGSIDDVFFEEALDYVIEHILEDMNVV